MARKNIPDTIRPLFDFDQRGVSLPIDKPVIENRVAEAKRVIKRLAAIILEHREVSLQLGFELGGEDLRIVIEALRDHAKGGGGLLKLSDYDEIQSHCLNRLYEELVEEPSNILYATPTGPDSTRYDAMDPSFWIECLNLLEEKILKNKN